MNAFNMTKQQMIIISTKSLKLTEKSTNCTMSKQKTENSIISIINAHTTWKKMKH